MPKSYDSYIPINTVLIRIPLLYVLFGMISIDVSTLGYEQRGLYYLPKKTMCYICGCERSDNTVCLFWWWSSGTMELMLVVQPLCISCSIPEALYDTLVDLGIMCNHGLFQFRSASSDWGKGPEPGIIIQKTKRVERRLSLEAFENRIYQFNHTPDPKRNGPGRLEVSMSFPFAFPFQIPRYLASSQELPHNQLVDLFQRNGFSVNLVKAFLKVFYSPYLFSPYSFFCLCRVTIFNNPLTSSPPPIFIYPFFAFFLLATKIYLGQYDSCHFVRRWKFCHVPPASTDDSPVWT